MMKTKYFFYLKKYVSAHFSYFITGILFAALKSIFSLLVPLTFSMIMDHALPDKNSKELLLYSALMTLGYLSMCGSGIVRDYCFSNVDELFVKNLRIRFLEKINRIKYQECEKIDSGYMMSKYNTETEVLQAHFGSQFVNLLPNLIILIYCSVFIIKSNYFILLISLVLIGLYLLINHYFGKRIERQAEQYIENNANAIAAFSDIHKNVMLTKLFNNFYKTNKRFQKVYDSYFRASVRLKLLSTLNINFSMMTLYISSGLMWLICGMSIINGTMTIGTLTVMISYQSMLLTPLAFFCEYHNSLKKAQASIQSIDLFFAKEEECFHGQAVSSAESISFNHVSYGYSDRAEILRDVSFTLEKGKIYGFSGPSGCGKSTITKLLLRLYQCTEGSIQYNGIDINKLNLEEYRNKFSVLSQDSCFYEDTIWDNLNVTENHVKEKIIKLSRDLDLYEEIIQFPLSFQMVLTQNAANVSGGQKKRLDALRGLCKSSDIIILDEAANGLDAVRKAKLYQLVQNIKNQKIIILISHDPEELNLADERYTLTEKRIIKSEI